MRLIGKAFGRLIVDGFGYIIACAAAGMAISLSIVLQAFVEGTIGISIRRLMAETLFAGGIIASFALVYAFAPAVVGIVIAEIFRVRRMAYHVLAGGLSGALAYVTPVDMDLTSADRFGVQAAHIGPHFALYIAAGFIGGYVFWGFAGRTAGIIETSA